jgi:hypothetical protein
MVPNPELSAHLECAKRVHVSAKKRRVPVAFRDPALLSKAITCLRAAGKILPCKLAAKIGIHRNTAYKLCIDLHEQGKLLRDGSSYTWNAIGVVVPGPMSPVFLGLVTDIMAFLDVDIKRRGKHNTGLSNAYINGGVNSCFDKKQWTDTLIAARKRLRNCLTVQNWDLLADIMREVALEVPDFLGRIYRRSEYAQAMLTAERKMAYAAKKPRTSKDDAFHADRQEKVKARLAAEKAARAEAARQQAAAFHEMAKQVIAADNPEDADALVARFAKGMTPAGIQAVVASTPPEPVQAGSCPGPPMIPDNIDQYLEEAI